MEAARLEGSMKERLTFMAALKSSRAKPTLPTFFSSTPQAWKTKTVSRLLGSAHTPSWNNSRARSWLPCNIRERCQILRLFYTQYYGGSFCLDTQSLPESPQLFPSPSHTHQLILSASGHKSSQSPRPHPVSLQAQILSIALPPLLLTLSASRHKSPQMPPCTLTRSASMQPQACQR